MSKHHEFAMGYFCGCVPLRSAAWLFGLYTVVLSFAAVASFLTEDTRILVGGYSYGARVIVLLLGGLGVFFGLACLVGLTDNAAGWVRVFSRFALLRGFLVAVVLMMDLESLKGCEKLGLGGDAFTSVRGDFNVALESVAFAGRCKETRLEHLSYALLDITLSVLAAYSTSRFSSALDKSPSYHISLGEARPLRVHTGYADVGYVGRPASRQEKQDADAANW